MKKLVAVIIACTMLVFVCSGCQAENETPFQYNQRLEAQAEVVNANGDGIENLLDNDKDTSFFVEVDTEKKVSFMFSFDRIYPLKDVLINNFVETEAMGLKHIQIYTSVNGIQWEEVHKQGYDLEANAENTIMLENKNAKYVKVMFTTKSDYGNWGDERNYGLSDVAFRLGEGYVAVEQDDFTDLFKRYEGWTGADGIFSFPVNGKDAYAEKSTSLFIFSDTFIGNVDKESNKRIEKHMINNSMAILKDGIASDENIEFIWGKTGEQDLDSMFSPKYKESLFVGHSAYNLVNSSGMSGYFDKQDTHENTSGETMFLADKYMKDEYLELIFDLASSKHVQEMWVWNYNEHQEYFKNLEKRGLKDIQIYTSNDKQEWVELKKEGYPYQLAMADGSERIEATNLNDGNHTPIVINEDVRYIKIKAKNERNVGNWGSANDNENRFGLSEVRFFDEDGKIIFAQVESNSVDRKISEFSSSSRYWLQDGVVIGDDLYLFPIIVKAAVGGNALSFQVTNVNMIKVPLIEGRPNLEAQEQFATPLYHKDDFNSLTYFGAGVINNTKEGGSLNPDGYIYVYGHTGANKLLAVARVKPEDIEDFNVWEFYADNDDWSKDIRDAKGICNHVSSELSVSSITVNTEGKFVLVYMKDTLSGIISYVVADTPYGPFENPHDVYYVEGLEGEVFSYNAKAHPHLSNKGELLVSYNVNSMDMSSFEDGDIYRPRFINLIEISKR